MPFVSNNEEIKRNRKRENMSYKEEFVEFMLNAGALTFGDFTTKSGRKTSYFINTGSYKTGSQIEKLGNFYAKCIYENMEAGNIPKDINCLFGPAYKGCLLYTSPSP